MDVGAEAAAELMKHRPCPHCGARARMEEDSELRWVCGVCGGPRVPVEDEAAHSDREREELVKAGRAKKMAFTYRIASIGLSLMGALLAALGVALGAVSVAVGAVLLVAAVAGIVMGIVYGRRAHGKREEAKKSTFEAWESVAEALLKVRGSEATAEQIAREMRTTVADVERMMSFLSVDNRVRIVVKDTELVYTTEAEAAAIEAQAIMESEEEDVDATHTAGADARRR
ncbi:hypothetical protein LVJ94_12470 [Pendulispora rubella]|uniref:Uncharacterized protein n=1 Tax=Pendulispora rubella TaxID=2741070 RepID=A0ABZ2LAW2_9BACT